MNLRQTLAKRADSWWRREIPARDQGWAYLRENYKALRAAELFGKEFEQWEELAGLYIKAVVSEIE